MSWGSESATACVTSAIHKALTREPVAGDVSEADQLRRLYSQRFPDMAYLIQNVPAGLRNALIRAGFTSWSAIALADDETLVGLSYVGKRGLRRIRELQQAQESDMYDAFLERITP
jgi:hypothetical protein